MLLSNKLSTSANVLLLLFYLPKPCWDLVLGTAPWRNSCFEFNKMSWFPAMMSTPSPVFLI